MSECNNGEEKRLLEGDRSMPDRATLPREDDPSTSIFAPAISTTNPRKNNISVITLLYKCIPYDMIFILRLHFYE